MKKTKSGISLIVLVITILVIAILAATVIITISNTNVISQTSQATFKSDMSSYKEAYELYITSRLADDSSFDRSSLSLTYSENADTFSEIFGEVPEKYQSGLQIQGGKLVYETEDETEKTVLEALGMELHIIGTETENGKSKYIGYYVEVEDGEYGVIFADLAVGGSCTWSGSTYSYEKLEDTTKLKEYVLSEKTMKTGFGEAPILKVKEGTVGTEDRFYVMALEDSGFLAWYDAAYDSGISDYSTVTSVDFGTGRANTNAMITAWNKGAGEGGYGAQDDNSTYKDIWGVIQDKASKGWFVPSINELRVFAGTFDITESDYDSIYGLGPYYWSSSLSAPKVAYRLSFIARYIDGSDILTELR